MKDARPHACANTHGLIPVPRLPVLKIMCRHRASVRQLQEGLRTSGPRSTVNSTRAGCCTGWQLTREGPAPLSWSCHRDMDAPGKSVNQRAPQDCSLNPRSFWYMAATGQRAPHHCWRERVLASERARESDREEVRERDRQSERERAMAAPGESANQNAPLTLRPQVV